VPSPAGQTGKIREEIICPLLISGEKRVFYEQETILFLKK